jgi:hypothetical protein
VRAVDEAERGVERDRVASPSPGGELDPVAAMRACDLLDGLDEPGPDAPSTVAFIDDKGGESALGTRAINELEDVKCRETDEPSRALCYEDVRVRRCQQSIEPRTDVLQV